MIIIKIQGGLGNQLLQYSIGRIIEMRHKKEVAYDLSFFDFGKESKYTKRPYVLDLFAISVRRATKEEILETRYPYSNFSRVISLIRRIINKYIFKKYYIGYQKDFFPMVSKHKNLYLEGYWQSYLYYEKDKELVSSSVVLKNSDGLDRWKKENNFDSISSVFVHIRRGDYLAKGSGISSLSKEYYKKAVNVIEQKVSSPVYYIFSDDILWVKENMGEIFNKAIYVSALSFSDHEEFSLMKSSKHGIIANSTFSFFAAFFSDHKNGVVIYPKDWKNIYLQGDNVICPPYWNAV